MALSFGGMAQPTMLLLISSLLRTVSTELIPFADLALTLKPGLATHTSGTVSYGAELAADGNPHTQLWLEAPLRNGAYVEVQLCGTRAVRNARGQSVCPGGPRHVNIRRLVASQDRVDFCRHCAIFVPLPNGQWGMRHVLSTGNLWSELEFSPPFVADRFRIQLTQEQAVWWQVFELEIHADGYASAPPPRQQQQQIPRVPPQQHGHGGRAGEDPVTRARRMQEGLHQNRRATEEGEWAKKRRRMAAPSTEDLYGDAGGHANAGHADGGAGAGGGRRSDGYDPNYRGRQTYDPRKHDGRQREDPRLQQRRLMQEQEDRQQHQQREAMVICSPACVNGECVLRPGAPPVPRAGRSNGHCHCRDGWRGAGCTSTVCGGPNGGCNHGECVAPNKCRCQEGWSGALCDKFGEVRFGSRIIFKSVPVGKPIFAANGLTSIASTRMAAIVYDEPPPQEQEVAEGRLHPENRNAFEVLGSSGTSGQFLRGEKVRDGDIVRLRHMATGGYLSADGSTSAPARHDLREVALTSATAVARETEDWAVMVDREELAQPNTGKLWAVGYIVVLSHRTTQHVLACVGSSWVSTSRKIFHKRTERVQEVVLHPPAVGSTIQRWSVSAFMDPTVTKSPVHWGSIIRLAGVSKRCYLRPSASQQVGGRALECKVGTGGDELWVVLRAEAAAAGTPDVVGKDNVHIMHYTTLGKMHLAGGLMGVGHPSFVDDATPDGAIHCIEVGGFRARVDEWELGASQQLGFCGHAHTAGGTIGQYVAEVVDRLPVNAGESDISRVLAERAMKSGNFREAESYYGASIRVAHAHVRRSIGPSTRGATGGGLKARSKTRAMRLQRRRMLEKMGSHLIHFRRGVVRTHLGFTRGALEDMTSASRLQASFVEADMYKSRILVSMGRWDEAMRGFEYVSNSSSRKHSSNAKQHIQTLGKFNASRVAAEETLHLAFKMYSPPFGGRCNLTQEDKDSVKWAKDQLTEILQIAPESVPVRMLRARALLLINDLGGAKLDATWGIRLAKQDAMGYLLRGQAHMYSLDHEMARTFFQWGLKVHPEDEGLIRAMKSLKALKKHGDKANLMFRAGDFEGAIDEYKDSLKAEPNHCLHTARMNLQLCRLHIYNDEVKIAIRFCRDALQQDPELGEADVLLRSAHKIAKDYQELLLKKKKEEIEQLKADAKKKEKEKEEAKAKAEAEAKGETYNPNAKQTNSSDIARQDYDWIGNDDLWMWFQGDQCAQYYMRLNISDLKGNLTVQKVKKWYRKAALKWHPDKHQGTSAKHRTKKKFELIVQAYEALSDEKQLSNCERGGTIDPDFEKPNEPRHKPEPGRNADAPPKPEPPVNAKLNWKIHFHRSGLLTDHSWRKLQELQPAYKAQFNIFIKFNSHEGARDIRYLKGFGNPNKLIHCKMYNPEDPKGEESFRKQYTYKDEFGSHTAGDGGAGGGEQQKTAQEEHLLPPIGEFAITFSAENQVLVTNKEQQSFSLAYKQYNVRELLDLADDSDGVAVLNMQMDNRHGTVTVVWCVTRKSGSGQGFYLRINSMTAHFNDGYWNKKLSLARMRRVAVSNTAIYPPAHNPHMATDGKDDTSYRTLDTLQKLQDYVVDLEMIYSLSEIDILEHREHYCQSCRIEISCDARVWHLVATSVLYKDHPDAATKVSMCGSGEAGTEDRSCMANRELYSQDSKDGWTTNPSQEGTEQRLRTRLDFRDRLEEEGGDQEPEEGAAPPPPRPPAVDPKLKDMGALLARYVRIRPDENNAAPPTFWQMYEINVLGNELSDSIVMGRAVMLEGGLEAQGDFTESKATDADANTEFHSRGTPGAGSAIVVDLVSNYRLALMDLQSPANGACFKCVVKTSLDRENWTDRLLIDRDRAGNSGVISFGPREHVVARYLKIEVLAHSGVWVVQDWLVYGKKEHDMDDASAQKQQERARELLAETGEPDEISAEQGEPDETEDKQKLR